MPFDSFSASPPDPFFAVPDLGEAFGFGVAFSSPLASGLGLALGLGFGEAFGLGFGEAFGVGLGVGFGVGLGVGFGVGVAVGFGVGVAVGLGVGVAEGVGVGVGVAVGVGVGDGVRTGRCDSTAWATQMKLLAAEVVRRLNDVLGDETVRVIEVAGPRAPSWVKGRLRVKGRGPRDTYG